MSPRPVVPKIAVLVASGLGRVEILRLLKAAVEREGGGQIAFAKRHGINRITINKVLNGKRPVSNSIARALGLHKEYVAEQPPV